MQQHLILIIATLTSSTETHDDLQSQSVMATSTSDAITSAPMVILLVPAIGLTWNGWGKDWIQRRLKVYNPSCSLH